MKKFSLLILSFCAACFSTSAQILPSLSQEYLQYERHDMNFKDSQVLLFNGRGFVSPMQHSMTQFTNVQFLPVQLPWYAFNLNLIEQDSRKEIRDDVATEWVVWEYTNTGYDPLGSNFRSNMPWVPVTQEENWKPNLYTRTGTFYKDTDRIKLNLALETATCVSARENKVFIRYQMTNRDAEPVALIVKPVHKKLGEEWNQTSCFQLCSEENWKIQVSSDLPEHSEEGFLLNIPGNETVTAYFSVAFLTPESDFTAICQNGIAEEFQRAQMDLHQSLSWASSRLPQVYTGIDNIDELYYRALLSVLMCRNEGEAFVIHPFWSVGTWPLTISWDNSFSSDIISMLDPESLKETLLFNFRVGQLKKTYLGWNGGAGDILYIQEPFAQKTMINAYINHTGDYSILEAQAGEHTIYEWMSLWAEMLHDKYGRADGLIDIGYSTELIIEIRTDGYNHVVPIVNCLAMDLYGQLSKWAEKLGLKKDKARFASWKETLSEAIDEKLWNPEEKWFDNLYPDGSRAPIYSYHLFDFLGSEYITPEQTLGLLSHMNDNEFLGEFGFYSIAKRDKVHWDRIDADWGGGGQYAGMPGRIVRNLYAKGNSILAWEALNRYAAYVDYFPYLSQNPAIDAPTQDRSSMPVQIAAGAAAEAIIFGTFGITQTPDHLVFKPVFHRGMEKARLSNYIWKGNRFEIRYHHTFYEVFCNDELIGRKAFGESVEFYVYT